METMHLEFEIQEIFRRRRVKVIACAVTALSALLGLGFLSQRAAESIMGIPMMFFMYILGVFIIAVGAYTFVFWRCPVCNSYLGRAINQQRCHDCGTRLRRA